METTIPKTLCDLLDFRDFDDCSLNLHLVDSTIKKPMGIVNDVIIVFFMFYLLFVPGKAFRIFLGDSYLILLKNRNFHAHENNFYF